MSRPDEPVIAHVLGRELPSEDVVVPTPRRRPLPLRLVYLVLGLALFVTALGLMRAGATELVPTLEGSVFTDNPWSTLGLGWLGACLVLSGSPVAASALSLLDGGAIDRTEAFTMLIGSRLGAAFVVLVVGAVYAVRGTGAGATRRAPISIGILSLFMTAVVYVPGSVIGYLLLNRGFVDDLSIDTLPALQSLTDTLFGWSVDLVTEVLPGWTLFPVGLAVLLLGFNLFDKVLPTLGSEHFTERGDAWYSRKWPMFVVGSAVTVLTLSVAVSLTLLVPLVARGYLRRANTLPYIAGANITTLIDTLVAAVILGDQDAVRVVVAVTLAVTVWTVTLLAVAYPALRGICLGFTRAVLKSNLRLGLFAAVLLLVPVSLIAV